MVGEFPQFIFGSPTTIGRFAIYGQTARPEQMRSVLESTERLIENYRGTLPKSIVVIMATPSAYAFINPASRNAFAVTRKFGNVIWVRDGSFSNNSSLSGHVARNRRSLSGVIAHESIHVALNADLGRIESSRLPSWLAEGYCDYVANETSYPFDEGIARVLADSSTTDASFRYFQYYAAVRHLMEVEKKSFAEIVQHAEDYKYQELAMQLARRASADNGLKSAHEINATEKSSR